MKKYNDFRIQTLSDNQNRLGDFLGILSGVTGLVGELFPSMFRERLKMSHLDKIFPGNGYWTRSYKQFILSHIAYISGESTSGMDFGEELILKTNAFTYEKMRQTVCKDVPASCWRPYGDTYECPECLQVLNRIMAEESFTGGGQYGEFPTPGGFGGAINYQSILIVGGIGLFLVMMMKKKK